MNRLSLRPGSRRKAKPRSARFVAPLAVAVLAVGSATACALVAARMTSSLAAAAAHAVPACADRQLAVGLGRADHGAGNVRLPVALTNTSAATCSVSGYLRVGLVGAHNRHGVSA